jgi:hypothetical protein
MGLRQMIGTEKADRRRAHILHGWSVGKRKTLAMPADGAHLVASEVPVTLHERVAIVSVLTKAHGTELFHLPIPEIFAIVQQQLGVRAKVLSRKSVHSGNPRSDACFAIA